MPFSLGQTTKNPSPAPVRKATTRSPKKILLTSHYRRVLLGLRRSLHAPAIPCPVPSSFWVCSLVIRPLLDANVAHADARVVIGQPSATRRGIEINIRGNAYYGYGWYDGLYGYGRYYGDAALGPASRCCSW